MQMRRESKTAREARAEKISLGLFIVQRWAVV